MSDATKAAVDDAIAAHIADECGGALVNGYVIQIEYVGMRPDAESGWFRMVAPGQTMTLTIGLVHYLAQRVAMAVGRR